VKKGQKNSGGGGDSRTGCPRRLNANSSASTIHLSYLDSPEVRKDRNGKLLGSPDQRMAAGLQQEEVRRGEESSKGGGGTQESKVGKINSSALPALSIKHYKAKEAKNEKRALGEKKKLAEEN